MSVIHHLHFGMGPSGMPGQQHFGKMTGQVLYRLPRLKPQNGFSSPTLCANLGWDEVTLEIEVSSSQRYGASGCALFTVAQRARNLDCTKHKLEAGVNVLQGRTSGLSGVALGTLALGLVLIPLAMLSSPGGELS